LIDRIPLSHSLRLRERSHRLLFLYLFRDFDKGTLDIGIEFTTISPLDRDRTLCSAVTLNINGLTRDRFMVDRSNRRILSLPGRYICYWVNGVTDSTYIYNRQYLKGSKGRYVHNSRAVKSEIAFDNEGFEVSAENLVSTPRRYHEKFIRLFRF
jgi:hypothetical protein